MNGPMTEEKLAEAIGMVGDDLICESATYKKKHKRYIVKIVAAVLAASIAVTFIWNNGGIVSADYSSEYNRVFGEFAAKSTTLLLQDKRQNTCYSPVSLFAALSLTAEATDGKTRSEILKVFGVDNLEELENMYSQMIVDMDVDYDKTPVDMLDGNIIYIDEPSKITLCNSLWIDDNYLDDNSKEVINSCVTNMKSDVFVVDKIDSMKVNQWVSEKTNGIIDNIMEDDAYKLLFINTLYYRAIWNPRIISPCGGSNEFKLEQGQKIKTTFLNDTANLRYKEMKEYTVVEVPLAQGNIMLILPDEGEKLESILKEKILNEILAMSTNSDMDEGYVDIAFPEFICQSDFSGELIEVAEQMGINALFGDNKWAISDKLNNEPIEMRQKTFIDVNLEGVVAGATTLLGMPVGIEPEIDLEITYDRPFMYILIKNGVPMFVGTVYNPAK